jgi:glutathione S-transferase
MAMKLNMLPPSVNNMSVRVFVRAAGIPVEEENVWGKTGEEEYLAKYPPGLTPTMYLATREGRDDLYPTDLKQRAMVDAANFYTLSILYPVLTRATYPRLQYSGYPGEVSTSDASDEAKEAARRSAEDALPRILDVFPAFWGTDTGFIGGGDSPTVADIRLACTLEFLEVTDTGIPDWAKDYISRVESALGEAYAEPAGDVRGYIAQVTGETVAAS